MKENYIAIGRLGKVHGLGGFLRLRLDQPQYEDDMARAGVLFAGDERAPLPYFVAEIKDHPMLLVRFEDLTTREAAEELAGQIIYLRETDLTQVLSEQPAADYLFLIGYIIQDAEAGEVGHVKNVVEYPQQWMAIVTRNGREILIPLHDDLIEEIDTDNQVLFMRLPEGLLEL